MVHRIQFMVNNYTYSDASSTITSYTASAAECAKGQETIKHKNAESATVSS